MSTTEGTDGNPPRRAAPRRVVVALGFFAWLVALPLAHGGLPWHSRCSQPVGAGRRAARRSGTCSG